MVAGPTTAGGGNSLLMGGALAAGWKRLWQISRDRAGNPLDVGRGRFIPTTSVDELYAELALWYGIGAGDLSFVLPNIGRFYDAGSGSAPIGLMI